MILLHGSQPCYGQRACITQQSYEPWLVRLCSKSSKLGFNGMNQELPDEQSGFRKDRGTREKISNICWIIEKTRE